MLYRSSERNHYNFFTFTTYPVFTWFILCATSTTTVSAQQILAFARTSSVSISFSLRAARTLAATALRCFLSDKSSIFGLWLQKQRIDAHLKQVISTYGRICHGGQHKTWSIWERLTSMRNSWDCGFKWSRLKIVYWISHTSECFRKIEKKNVNWTKIRNHIGFSFEDNQSTLISLGIFLSLAGKRHSTARCWKLFSIAHHCLLFLMNTCQHYRYYYNFPLW